MVRLATTPLAEPASPPGPRGLGYLYGGAAIRFDTQRRRKSRTLISDGDPPGEHVGAIGRAAAQPERAVRDRVDREAADLVHMGRADLTGPGLDLELPGARRQQLAEQRVPGDLELEGEVIRGEGEGSDRGRLRSHHSHLTPVHVGVVGEL